jgi:polyisoprenoid-binding protein YceI
MDFAGSSKKMNAMNRSYLFFAAALLGSCALQAQALRYDVHPDTKMSISGTSTIHSWTSEVTAVKGAVEIDAAVVQAGFKPGDKVKSVNLAIPVNSIVSPRGAAMDKKTFEALKEDRFPEIRFVLTDNKVLSANAQGFTLEASGNLEVAGVTRAVTLTVNGVASGRDRYQFTGSKKLNMRDFDMEPPTAMFGQIVTGEEVEIAFTLITTNTP